MRVGIAGAGGVGGLIGGFLARQGTEIALLARGAHLDALRARGLRFEGTLGEFTVRDFAVSSRGGELGRCDVVFVAVKTWQLERTLTEIRPMVGLSPVRPQKEATFTIKLTLPFWPSRAPGLPSRVAIGVSYRDMCSSFGGVTGD